MKNIRDAKCKSKQRESLYRNEQLRTLVFVCTLTDRISVESTKVQRSVFGSSSDKILVCAHM